MKYSKELLVAFGLLDAMLFGRIIQDLIPMPFLRSGGNLFTHTVTILRPLLVVSLGFSAYGFVMQKRWAMVMSYFQFPIRFLFVCLSLGFISVLFKNCANLIYLAMILEFVRLYLTVRIQRHLITRLNQS